MARTATTRKTTKTVKKSTEAKTVKKAAPKKAAAKKNNKQPAYVPLKDTTYVFVDFSDKELAADIVALGGKVTKSLKTAHILVCEDIWGDKAMDGLNKYDRIDDGRNKDEILEYVAELKEMGSKPMPTLQVGKKSIVVLSEWFVNEGVPLAVKDEDDANMTSEDSGLPYDCCFHDDGNVADMYTRLTRLQLLQEKNTDKYIVTQKQAYLQDLATGSYSSTRHNQEFNDFDEAVVSFQNRFKEEVGYTWKNRATCKPKKGMALVVDLKTFNS